MSAPENDGILRKIQGLLDTAESYATTNPEAAENYRAKADQLIVKFAVEQYELDEARAARGEARQSKPVVQTVLIPWLRGDVGHAHYYLYHDMARAIGLKVILDPARNYAVNEDGKNCYNLKVVGYDTDIAYAQMLYLSLQLQMLKMLFPEPDPSLPFDANVYSLHEAGVKWKVIRDKVNKCAVDNNLDWEIIDWPDGHRLIRACRRWCKKIGEEYIAVINPDNYKRSFGDAFTERIAQRLRGERNTEPGTALVLVKRQQEVNDLYSDLHAELFPKREDEGKRKKVAKVKARQTDYVAYQRGKAAADKADLSRPGSHINKPTAGRLGN